MKGTIAFLFFMLFLAGIALVNLRGMQEETGILVESEAQLLDVAWRPVSVGDREIAADTPMLAQFAEKSAIAGNAGCNRFFGQYELSNGGLSFGMLGTARMACDETAMADEDEFLNRIQETASAWRNEDQLTFRDAEGNVLFRFVAVPRTD